jgi:hypothetical protein
MRLRPDSFGTKWIFGRTRYFHYCMGESPVNIRRERVLEVTYSAGSSCILGCKSLSEP